jgi:hypothetical protein
MYELVRFFVYQWALAMESPLPVFVALATGLIIGFLGAWLILRNRLKRDRELIAYFKAALANPAEKRRDRR